MAKRKNNKLKVTIAKNNVLYYYLKGKRIKSAEGQKIQEQQFQKRHLCIQTHGIKKEIIRCW